MAELHTEQEQAVNFSHGKVIFTSAAVGREGKGQHPPLPCLTSNPQPAYLGYLEGAGLGRISPESWKAAFVSSDPPRPCLPALSANHKLSSTTRNAGELTGQGQEGNINQMKGLQCKVSTAESNTGSHPNLSSFSFVG